MIKMTDIEIWKDIKDYEGLYQVSNIGRIKSLNYNHTGKEKVMKPYKTKKGYFYIHLCKNGERKLFLVHRLVAETFLPNPDNLPQVNHKIEGKEGKSINMVIFNRDGSVNEEKSTIEWCTQEYNHNYGTINERIALAHTNGKQSKRVLQFTLDGKLVREWPSVGECGRNGFNQGNIAACCRGLYESMYGFRWKYK